MNEILDLWDYRRRVLEIYRTVRIAGSGRAGWEAWTAQRDSLFAQHPQSPVEDRETFAGLPYFPYDENWRTVGRFVSLSQEKTVLSTSGQETARFVKAGALHFDVHGYGPARLDLLWLDAYGGGSFLPFRDLTNGSSTYGGGRYLLDVVKGADLGHRDDEVVLDFNYAYHPSCVHSPRWVCPLAPPSNHLDIAVEAGERLAPR